MELQALGTRVRLDVSVLVLGEALVIGAVGGALG